MDCGGNDISHSTLSFDACSDACSDDSECVGIVTSPDNDCWLKSICNTDEATVASNRNMCMKRSPSTGMLRCINKLL